MNRPKQLSIKILLVLLDKELEERRLLGGKLDVAGGDRDPLLDVRHVQQPLHRRCQGQVSCNFRLAYKDKLVEVSQIQQTILVSVSVKKTGIAHP